MTAVNTASRYHQRSMTDVLASEPHPGVYAMARAEIGAGRSIIPVGVEFPCKKIAYAPALIGTGHWQWKDKRGPDGKVVLKADGTPEQRKSAMWTPFQARAATFEELRSWFVRYAAPGLAQVCGKPSSRVCLDFDGEAGQALMRAWGLVPHVLTPTGGAHVYVEYPGWHVPTLNSKAHPQLAQWQGLVDVRGDGGLAVLPPTEIPGVGAYTLARFLRPELLDRLPDAFREKAGLLRPPAAVAPAPRVVVVALARTRANAGEDERADWATMLEKALSLVALDGRDKAGFWLAVQLRDNRYEPGEADDVGAQYVGAVPPTNTKGVHEPYGMHDWIKTRESAYSRPARRAYGDLDVSAELIEDAERGLAQVKFTNRPSKALREALAGAGFRFRDGAWSRRLTSKALADARHILDRLPN